MPGRKRATKYSFRCVCSNGLVETARLTVAGIFPIFNVMLHSSPRDCEGETVLAFEAQARAQLLAHFSLLFRRELLNCLDNFLPQLLQRHQLRLVLRLLLHKSLCALTHMTNAVFAVMVFYRKIVSSLMAGVSFANGASRRFVKLLLLQGLLMCAAGGMQHSFHKQPGKPFAVHGYRVRSIWLNWCEANESQPVAARFELRDR
jgi:hypothetical protein